ncbi:hypothetical protein [Mesorhizobium sp. M0933]|uniref:hypothetical protein n=1 Tax=unclassified Mesorhizobium TaxID=325217 RepID=UPI003338859E
MANALFIVMNRVSIGGIGSGPISQLRRRRLLTPLPLRVLHGWAAGFLAKLELYSIIARIIGRRISIELTETLDSMPAVALLGPLQVGKTTLAPEIAERRPSIYLDLESDADRARLAEPELLFGRASGQAGYARRGPPATEPVPELRGLIDRGRLGGRKAGRFLPKSNAWHPTKLPLRGGQRLFVLSTRTGKERHVQTFAVLLQSGR